MWIARIHSADNNITALIGFGCLADSVCYARENISLLPEDAYIYRSGGYDGQFYYYAAAGLFSDQTPHLDAASFRMSRIGYPLLIAPAFLITSKNVAVVWMSLVLLLFHLLGAALLYDFLRSITDRASAVYGTLVYSLNPFSLLSFQLNVSDGLALSLMVMALSLALKPVSGGWRIPVAWVFFTFALLTKETFIAAFAGGVGAVILMTFARVVTAGQFLRSFTFFLSALLVLLGWWYFAGFTPLQAARRGSLPLQGMVAYLASPDSAVSGRNLLVMLFFIYLSIAGVMMRGAVNHWREKISRSSISWFGPEGRLWNPGFSLYLFSVAGLVSFATVHEYWANFANVARLFTPGVIPLAIFAAVQGSGTFKRIKPGVSLFIVLFFIFFSGLLLKGQLRSKFPPSVEINNHLLP